MKENKKIKNATECIINLDGEQIKCKSQLEAYTLKRLYEEEFNFKYEKTQYIFLEPFKLNPIIKTHLFIVDKKTKSLSNNKLNSIRSWTYTPDIIVTIPIQMSDTVTMDINCIIECKGFKNDLAPLKRKFLIDFLNHLNPDQYYYFEPTNHKTIDEMIEVLKVIKNIKINQTTTDENISETQDSNK